MRCTRLMVILLLVFSVGCGPTIMEGKRIDASKRDEIIKGQTTAAQVVEIFGKPDKIEKLSAGEEKYIYQYYREQFTRWWTLPAVERQKMDVLIKNGVVRDYVYSVEERGRITEEDRK